MDYADIRWITLHWRRFAQSKHARILQFTLRKQWHLSHTQICTDVINTGVQQFVVFVSRWITRSGFLRDILFYDKAPIIIIKYY